MVSTTNVDGVALGLVQVGAELEPAVAGGDEEGAHKGRALLVLVPADVGH